MGSLSPCAMWIAPSACWSTNPAIVAWAATGPLFKFSDTWQLVVNTATSVVTFLMVFIIQNSQSVNISFFGAHGHLSLGVAMLLAAIGGVLLVAIPGYGRILQLRRALRRTGHSKARSS